MTVRTPIVAGQFYPSCTESASAEVRQCLDSEIDRSDLPTQILAGVVPHAGWACSGRVAGRVFNAVSLYADTPATFVIFGAVHRHGVRTAAAFTTGVWKTPSGEMTIDEQLAEKLIARCDLIQDNPSAHNSEHSIEVQLPLIQELFPKAKIVPIMVPPNAHAPDIGAAVGAAVRDYDGTVLCIGSTDLTHYGPSYAFTPKGIGADGVRWAKEVNDRQLLDHICRLDPQAVLKHAASSHSACGAGAISATIAAAVELGADTVRILEHTTSAEVLAERYGPDMTDSVGYAAIIFGKD